MCFKECDHLCGWSYMVAVINRCLGALAEAHGDGVTVASEILHLVVCLPDFNSSWVAFVTCSTHGMACRSPSLTLNSHFNINLN